MTPFFNTKTEPKTQADPSDVLVIEFNDPLLAQEAVLATTRLSRRGSVQLADAVIVHRDQKGKARIQQTREVSPMQAATSGSLWLGLAGLAFGGTIGWLIGLLVGGLGGWLWASRRDRGIPNPWLAEVGRRLTPGSTATVVMLSDFYPMHLLSELRRFRGRLMFSSLPGVDAESLEDALTGVG
jgi:uncharacterized membrane protein